MKQRWRFLLFFGFFLAVWPLAVPAQAATLVARLSGKILLQVQDKGEAWYVNPQNQKRYYLGRPSDAYQVMRSLSTGISEKEFATWNHGAPSWAVGRFYLRPQSHGEAYYVSFDRRWHYLGRPTDAWLLLRTQGLGVTNDTLLAIPAATVNVSPVVPNNTDTEASDYTAALSWRYNLKWYQLNLPLKTSIYKTYNSGIKTLYYTSDADEKAVREDFYSFFFNFKPGDTAVADIVAYGRQVAVTNSWTRDQLVDFLMALVQYIPYDNSKVSSNQLQPNYPYETLYKDSGICSDKTFLAVAILRDLGYGAAILDFPNLNHSAAGVSCPVADSVAGSGYCYVETTGYFPIGVIPPAISNGQAVTGQTDLSQAFDVSHLNGMEVYQKTSGSSYQGVTATKARVASIIAAGKAIDQVEQALGQQKTKLTTEQNNLSALKTQLDNYEASGDAASYNSLVDSYNSGVNDYNTELAAYREKLAEYNNNIDAYNQSLKDFYQL